MRAGKGKAVPICSRSAHAKNMLGLETACLGAWAWAAVMG
jgi:hypothetical protein